MAKLLGGELYPSLQNVSWIGKVSFKGFLDDIKGSTLLFRTSTGSRAAVPAQEKALCVDNKDVHSSQM